jgi:hypothetical protein
MTQKEHCCPIWSEHSGFKVKPSAAAGFEAPVRYPCSSTTIHTSILAIGHRNEMMPSRQAAQRLAAKQRPLEAFIRKDACG